MDVFDFHKYHPGLSNRLNACVIGDWLGLEEPKKPLPA
jgi:hypothetical protein